MSVLELKNLSKFYSHERVFKNLNFSLSKGEIVLLKGANGSGKTTLLECLSGLLSPSSGEIRSNYKKLGYMAAQSMLYTDLTIEENLILHGRLSHVRFAQVQQVIEKLNLEKVVHKKISECSLGMAKRASLARVLLADPDLILLDEPFSGLDEDSQKLLVSILLELKEAGVSLIIASHQFEILKNLVNRTIAISSTSLTEEFLSA